MRSVAPLSTAAVTTISEPESLPVASSPAAALIGLAVAGSAASGGGMVAGLRRLVQEYLEYSQMLALDQNTWTAFAPRPYIDAELVLLPTLPLSSEAALDRTNPHGGPLGPSPHHGGPLGPSPHHGEPLGPSPHHGGPLGTSLHHGGPFGPPHPLVDARGLPPMTAAGEVALGCPMPLVDSKRRAATGWKSVVGMSPVPPDLQVRETVVLGSNVYLWCRRSWYDPLDYRHVHQGAPHVLQRIGNALLHDDLEGGGRTAHVCSLIPRSGRVGEDEEAGAQDHCVGVVAVRCHFGVVQYAAPDSALFEGACSHSSEVGGGDYSCAWTEQAHRRRREHSLPETHSTAIAGSWIYALQNLGDAQLRAYCVGCVASTRRPLGPGKPLGGLPSLPAGDGDRGTTTSLHYKRCSLPSHALLEYVESWSRAHLFALDGTLLYVESATDYSDEVYAYDAERDAWHFAWALPTAIQNDPPVVVDGLLVCRGYEQTYCAETRDLSPLLARALAAARVSAPHSSAPAAAASRDEPPPRTVDTVAREPSLGVAVSREPPLAVAAAAAGMPTVTALPGEDGRPNGLPGRPMEAEFPEIRWTALPYCAAGRMSYVGLLARPDAVAEAAILEAWFSPHLRRRQDTSLN